MSLYFQLGALTSARQQMVHDNRDLWRWQIESLSLEMLRLCRRITSTRRQPDPRPSAERVPGHLQQLGTGPLMERVLSRRDILKA